MDYSCITLILDFKIFYVHSRANPLDNRVSADTFAVRILQSWFNQGSHWRVEICKVNLVVNKKRIDVDVSGSERRLII